MRKAAIVFLLVVLNLVHYGGAAQLNKQYFYWAGRNFLVENNYPAAIETLNVLLRSDPGAHEAYFLRGVAKFNLDDLLGAEQDFTLAIDRNPVYTMAYNARAITRSRLGNYDDALGDFREAIELRPDMAGPYYSRGMTYLMTGQAALALDDFNSFARIEPRVADGYIGRGMALLSLADTTRAYDEFSTAIRTNREDPAGYYRRGLLHAMREEYPEALADLDGSIAADSTYVPSVFTRAVVYERIGMPVEALGDFDRVIGLDSLNMQAWFNRALVRADIGDYNRALDDYDVVARHAPGNVLVYYNRAGLHARLGDLSAAAADYGRAIELYPDFANAYLNRSNVRYMQGDMRGSRADRATADRKIAEYRERLDEGAFSIYADTSRLFDELLSFDAKMTGGELDRAPGRGEGMTLLGLFRFSFMEPATATLGVPVGVRTAETDEFRNRAGTPRLVFTRAASDLTVDSLLALDARLDRRIATAVGHDGALLLFQKGITESLLKQYTNSIGSYSDAIGRDPADPFLYINRSTARSEMIDFISSFDNTYQRISVDRDPASRLHDAPARTYNYDEAIADLNSAARLLPGFAWIYYNRGNLQALSGRLPEAYDDYTEALRLDPAMGEAYYNRGLVQIFMKDTRKGLLDVSKAGELGIGEAYTVLRRYRTIEE